MAKSIWLNQELNTMLNANKPALKLIDQSTKHNKDHTGSKELTILIGNHVLCVITQKVGTRSRIGTSLTFMSW